MKTNMINISNNVKLLLYMALLACIIILFSCLKDNGKEVNSKAERKNNLNNKIKRYKYKPKIFSEDEKNYLNYMKKANENLGFGGAPLIIACEVNSITYYYLFGMPKNSPITIARAESGIKLRNIYQVAQAIYELKNIPPTIINEEIGEGFKGNKKHHIVTKNEINELEGILKNEFGIEMDIPICPRE